MKEYPKTFGFNKSFTGQNCVAFFKYDGSNLRFCYSRKQRKWYKFGTRRHLFQEGDPEYGASIPVFMEKYADGLAKVFHDTHAWRLSQHMIVYAEYFGPKSFAGWHDSEDPKDVVLFDVNIHKRGFLDAEEFLKTLGHLPVAEVIYRGPMTEEFFHDVRNGGKYNLNEGVMCKGGSGHKMWMCKIKTLDFLRRLKERYAEKWVDFWE
jgi:hypothetical protein